MCRSVLLTFLPGDINLKMFSVYPVYLCHSPVKYLLEITLMLKWYSMLCWLLYYYYYYFFNLNWFLWIAFIDIFKWFVSFVPLVLCRVCFSISRHQFYWVEWRGLNSNRLESIEWCLCMHRVTIFIVMIIIFVVVWKCFRCLYCIVTHWSFACVFFFWSWKGSSRSFFFITQKEVLDLVENLAACVFNFYWGGIFDPKPIGLWPKLEFKLEELPVEYSMLTLRLLFYLSAKIKVDTPWNLEAD